MIRTEFVYTKERVAQMDAEQRAHAAYMVNTSSVLYPEEKEANLKVLYPPDRRNEILLNIQAGAADISDINGD